MQIPADRCETCRTRAAAHRPVPMHTCSVQSLAYSAQAMSLSGTLSAERDASAQPVDLLEAALHRGP